MPTDDKRREVARRLRETGEELGSAALLWYHIAKALGVRAATDGKTACGMLADLIEPGEPKGVCGECGHFNTADRFLPCDAYHGITAADVSACEDFEPRKCDRDALLALADEIEFNGAGALDDGDWCKPLLIEYAHRIREALGVVE